MTTAKWVILAGWVVLLAGVLVGEPYRVFALAAALLLAVVHAVEFVVKLSVLRNAPGPISGHFLKVMIFGLFHWRPLEKAQQSGVH